MVGVEVGFVVGLVVTFVARETGRCATITTKAERRARNIMLKRFLGPRKKMQTGGKRGLLGTALKLVLSCPTS